MTGPGVARKCLGTMTVWFLPPELAWQVLSFVLETWVKQPLITAALFFIPSTALAFWCGLSRNLCVQLRYLPLLPIPIIVLYLPPHTRALSLTNRLD
jgi:hypothetical protein